MLAPGEYLINPVTHESIKTTTTTPVAGRKTELTPVAASAEKSDDERPSFLLILLRALGAVHS
jgi:hypothetical protein